MFNLMEVTNLNLEYDMKIKFLIPQIFTVTKHGRFRLEY